MKRFAAHRVYVASSRVTLPLHVVEVNDSNRVCRIFPLRCETARTEWLGGMMVVASYFPPREPDESFAAYTARLSRFRGVWQQVARITPFNLSDSEFTPESRIIPLR